MAATFRKFLVLDVATCQASAFEFFDRPRRVFRPAKTGVRIDDARNFHRTRNVAGELRHFGKRQQSDIRDAGRRVAQTGAADVERIESAALNKTPHRRVEHAWHCDTAVFYELPQTRPR